MGLICSTSRSQEVTTQRSVVISKKVKQRPIAKTQSSMEDIGSSEFLQIGFELNTLGKLKPEVQRVLGEIGPFQEAGFLDDPSFIHQFSYFQYPDSSIFYGQLKNGMRHGIGRQHWLNEGNYLEGTWVDDKANGPARMIYPNGDIFEGQLIDNKANGYGTFKNKKKEVRGYWIDNKLQGEGVEFRKSGLKYEGTFANGIIEGKGTFFFPDGRKYTGQVHQGQLHGRGVMTWSDCSYYKGDFACNRLKGYGCYTHVSGQVYTGYFISFYHQDVNQLEILYSKQPNIEDQDHLKIFRKQQSYNICC